MSDTKVRVVSIVGKANSGKTTLLEALIPVLLKRGLKVGTIKHDVHGFQIDYEGKDSYRHRLAGARTVVLSSPQAVAVMKQVAEEQTVAELVNQYLADVDIVLTEGYKSEPWPKIEVLGPNDKQLLTKENLLAVVCWQKRAGLPVPVFTFTEVEEVADLILAIGKERVVSGVKRIN